MGSACMSCVVCSALPVFPGLVATLQHHGAPRQKNEARRGNPLGRAVPAAGKRRGRPLPPVRHRGGPTASPSGQRGDGGDEIVAAFLEIRVLVEAGRGRRQQNGVARLRLGRGARHGAVHGFADLVRGLAHLQREVARRMADQIGLGDVTQMRRQRGDAAVLAQPAGDPADAAEGLQRLRGAVDIGRLAVVDEGDTAALGDDLAAVGQPLEAVERLLDQPWRQASARAARHRRRRRSGGCAGPAGRGCRAGRCWPAAGPCGSRTGTPLARAPTSPGRSSLRVAEIADQPRIRAGLGDLVGQKAALCLVHADHRTVRPALGEEPPLGREIAAQPAVAVEVVGAEIGENGHVGGQRAGQLCLVGAEFQHHHAAIAGRVDVQHAAADIAGQLALHAGMNQAVMDQRGRGRLAVRAGHRDYPRRHVVGFPCRQRQRGEKQPDIVVHRHQRVPGRGDGRVRRRVEMRDAGRDDQRGEPINRAGRGEVVEHKALRRGGLARLGAVVPDHRLGAAGGQSARRGEPGPAEPEHAHSLAFMADHRDHRRTPFCPPLSCRRPSGAASAAGDGRTGALPRTQRYLGKKDRGDRGGPSRNHVRPAGTTGSAEPASRLGVRAAIDGQVESLPCCTQAGPLGNIQPPRPRASRKRRFRRRPPGRRRGS